VLVLLVWRQNVCWRWAVLWNSLPVAIRNPSLSSYKTFSRLPKTHFFIWFVKITSCVVAGCSRHGIPPPRWHLLKFHINHVAMSIETLTGLVTLTYRPWSWCALLPVGLATLLPILTSCFTDTYAPDRGAISVERFHINHVASATRTLLCQVTLIFDRLSVIRIFVLHLCTKLQFVKNRLSRSEDIAIAHLVCEYYRPGSWPLTFWPLDRFTGCSWDGIQFCQF